ncbi:hypothetical protein LOOC260_107620 [Paucilactobacillus hokkaidonensis JCM 18461]|uniref:Uncharacterized protein n=2 Tax=Paucilactobacillus hokkaidonensis TaxID=1193095 RepID=A0A0A1GSN9_9LACO|nr:hypothetical protein [Paucilactobacillus hokkaidonensis]KRO09288.1 hypothetical protein IV59_GL000741 [Paucilactobacillus hokkaidonensis]BAP85302.1 hypothetical protein LOOC260_107620 [Paucilactobacillus hokkaidonensis JCM 18461]
MKKAVLVYYRTNMLLQGPFYKPLYGIKKYHAYIDRLQQAVSDRKLDWNIIADDTDADIEKLEQENVDVVLCEPGLEKFFNAGDFPTNKILFLDSLSYYNTDVLPALNFLIHQNNIRMGS